MQSGDMVKELARVMEIASAVLDGEEVSRIIGEKAMYYVANPHPKYRGLAGDHYRVDHELFLRVKKLLLRIMGLSKLEINAQVLVPVPGTEFQTVALHIGRTFRYYRKFGQLRLEADAEVKKVYATGGMVEVLPERELPLASMLGPIYNSLGEVAGVIELSVVVAGEGQAWP